MQTFRPCKQTFRELNSAIAYQPGDCLRHPISLIMLLLWLLNDHIFKSLWGNAITGKLSDIAGLVVFPLMLVAAYEILCAFRQRQTSHLGLVLWMSIGLSSMIMVLINLSDNGAQLCRFTLGILQWPFRCLWYQSLVPVQRVQLTMDSTDLWTLCVLVIPYSIVRSRLNK